MIDKQNYEIEYLRNLQEKYKKDPALLERVLYAFGMLEALKESGLSFIFKGGTCLMLLLDRPMRLSTDIDIIVEPGTDVDRYIKKAGSIFPFISCEEQVRVRADFIKNAILNLFINRPCREKNFTYSWIFCFQKFLM